MILSKFTKRERVMIVITTTVVFSTLTYGFVIEPLIGAWSRLNNQIESSSSKLQRNYRLLKKADIIKKEYEKYANLIKPSPSDEEEIAAMLKVVESIARANDIFITNIRPQPAKDRVFYKEFLFELIAESDTGELVKFIYDIQGSGNLLRIRKLTLSTSSSKQKKLKAVMEITKPSFKISAK